MQHYAILTDNQSNHRQLVQDLMAGKPISGLEVLAQKRGSLFSSLEIQRYMDEEERHDIKVLGSQSNQPLKTMSSGEQKKALLEYLLQRLPDYLVLVNPFDNLDSKTQKELREKLEDISKRVILVQIVSRIKDILPFTTHFARLKDNNLFFYNGEEHFRDENRYTNQPFQAAIPPPLHPIKNENEVLARFNNVSVSFGEKQILKNIDWTIKKGEFWQLIGPNGSGKTTLLTMITGDSHKGYGQDLTIFGHKKGSGESVWDLKQHIGYFTPSMTDRFRGYHTLENMLISGLHDSVGLYVMPSDSEKRLANEWLNVLGLNNRNQTHFHDLNMGQQRLLMTARAMIKHPLLLILDEPTAGLDDQAADLCVSLVNKIAAESNSAILFVSHRKEAGLKPQKVFELLPTKGGSVGKCL